MAPSLRAQLPCAASPSRACLPHSLPAKCPLPARGSCVRGGPALPLSSSHTRNGRPLLIRRSFSDRHRHAEFSPRSSLDSPPEAQAETLPESPLPSAAPSPTTPPIEPRPTWLEYDMALHDKDLPRALSIATALAPQKTTDETAPKSAEFLDLPAETAGIVSAGGPGQAQIEGGPAGKREVRGEEAEEEAERQRRWLQLLEVGKAESDLRVVGQTYEWLRSQGLLRNFGRFQNSILEGVPRVVTPKVLKDRSGLEAKNLAPQKWGMSSPLLPIALFAAFSALVDAGVDLRPLTFISLALAVGDTVYLGGAGAGQLLMLLWAPFRERVLVHEAGHIVAAYLLGCPVRGVVLDAFEAMRMGVRGQAGTQFWDERLEDELRAGQLSSASVDRYSIVLFAGVAAEAVQYGQAEGGEGDENLFKAFLSNLQPSWSGPQMANQARWAVLQAYLLLQRNRAAHSAVVEVLKAGGGMGDVVMAIEQNMAG
ncbi:unnamed protein product [Closterium sp. NIES-64]|nr:unnamed protein product [Closterium sp. NIES-65]CAI5972084.1 unnamed protein product [Closterium sp. NIES-64]CAI5996110.1 unnamed protein product [Closterium sp. NIES-64]